MTRAKRLLFLYQQQVQTPAENISSITRLTKSSASANTGTLLTAKSSMALLANTYVKIEFDYTITCTQITTDVYPYIQVMGSSNLGSVEFIRCSTSVSETSKTITGHYSSSNVMLTGNIAASGTYLIVTLTLAAAYSFDITNLSLTKV